MGFEHSPKLLAVMLSTKKLLVSGTHADVPVYLHFPSSSSSQLFSQVVCAVCVRGFW